MNYSNTLRCLGMFYRVWVKVTLWKIQTSSATRILVIPKQLPIYDHALLHACIFPAFYAHLFVTVCVVMRFADRRIHCSGEFLMSSPGIVVMLRRTALGNWLISWFWKSSLRSYSLPRWMNTLFWSHWKCTGVIKLLFPLWSMFSLYFDFPQQDTVYRVGRQTLHIFLTALAP